MSPFTRRAIERIAENRIRQAIEAGELDHLPLGAPIAGLDAPYDELWWVKSWLRRERQRLADQKPCDRRRAAVARVELVREVKAERVGQRGAPRSTDRSRR